MSVEQHMPDVYDFGEGTDLSSLAAAIDLAISTTASEVESFIADLGLSTASGEGMEHTAENYDVGRPPGMTDARYAVVTKIIAGGRRCTIAIIRALLEAMTGLTWTVKDRQQDLDDNSGNWGIPLFEVWAQADFVGQPYGLAYASFDTHIDGHPVESGIGVPVIDALGKDGGEFNFKPME